MVKAPGVTEEPTGRMKFIHDDPDQLLWLYRLTATPAHFTNISCETASVAEPEPRSRNQIASWSRGRNYELRLRLLSIYHRLEEIS